MKATPNSSEDKILWIKINKITSKKDLFCIKFPIRVSRRWPETILAIKRILKVKGRMIFLIISIRTINLIKAVGVPLGTRWLNIFLVKFVHPKIINPSHRGKEIIKFSVMCLDGVKMFGNKPIIFKNKIIINKEIKILSLLSFVVFNAILNCFVIWLINST